MTSRTTATVTLSLGAALALACSSPPVEPVEQTPTGLDVTPSTLRMNQGTSQQLIARVIDQDGNTIVDLTVRFSSDDRSVIDVDSTGFVTAVGPARTANVIASALEFREVIQVTVEPVVGSLTVVPNAILLVPRASALLVVSALDLNGDPMLDPNLLFTVDPPAAATVSNDGIVTGRAAGTGTVSTSAGTVTVLTPLTVVPRMRLPLDGSPFGVATRSDGVAYVTRIAGNSVARLDLPFLDVRDALDLGPVPAHVSFATAGDAAYFTLQTGRALARVDVTADSEVRRLNLGDDGFNLVVSADGGTVHTTTGGGMLYEVDAATLTKRDSIQLDPVANGLALHPTNPLLYVSSRDGGTLFEIDLDSYSVQRVFALGGSPQRVAITPDGQTAFVANELNGIDVVDLATGNVQAPIDLGGDGLGLAMTSDGATIYVSLPLAGMIKVVDVASRTVTMEMDVGGLPRNIAITTDDHLVLIPNESGWIDVIGR